MKEKKGSRNEKIGWGGNGWKQKFMNKKENRLKVKKKKN
jgi:hypothetical protein